MLLNDYKELLLGYGVMEYLNRLQVHQNKYIYELVELIITEFFDEEFEKWYCVY